MSYYTNYEVSVTGFKDFKEAYTALQEFKEIVVHGIYDETLCDNEFEFSISEASWYDNEDDCLRFSKKYPNTTITVHGDGEENGDIWKARYRNGEFERIKLEVVLPPFQTLVD